MASKNSQRSDKKIGSGCVVLFCLPFAAFSAFMGWRLVSMLLLAWAASDWVERPAFITSLELQRGETERVVATYSYEFAGQKYTSDRVTLQSDSDNLGSFHQDLYRRLDAERKSGKPSVCFVDPNNPDQALLHRELRLVVVVFHLPFVFAFGLVGFGGIVASTLYGRNEGRRKSKLEQFPDEPWRMRDDWAAGEIKSDRWKTLLPIGAMALFWNLILLPFPFVVFGDNAAPLWVVIMVAVFMLVGIGLLATAIYQLVRTLRYGSSTLRLACVPGVVGGELVGVVMVPSDLVPRDGFRTSLRCWKRRTVDKGAEPETSDVIIWEDQRLVGKALDDPKGGSGVPVRFMIPSDAKPTDPSADDPISWKLAVQADVFGPNFIAEFEVPVFVTADSQGGVVATGEKLTPYEVVEPLAQQLQRDGLKITQDLADRFEIVSPPFRNVVVTAMLILMGVVFAAIGIGFFGWGNGFDRYLFGIVFTAVGGVMAVGGIAMLFRYCVLKIVGTKWEVISGWHLLTNRTRSFGSDEIKDIGAKNAMHASSAGKETKVWNDVVARLAGGRKVVLVRGISDRSAERRLIEKLRSFVGQTGGNEMFDSQDAL